MNKLLSPNDIVGGSFWLLSMMMIGATLFFFAERTRVEARWQTLMTLMGVVMAVAAVQYYYLKEMWMGAAKAPLVLRYLDWAVTWPIQIVSFFVLLWAVTAVSTALFWRLLVGSLVPVVAQFLGSAGYLSPTLGFLIGMIGWLYILGELYLGEASSANIKSPDERARTAFFSLRLIVTVGWAIYPLGYFVEHLGGGVDVNTMNIIYNFADILNKLIFGLVIYAAVVGRKRSDANS